MSTILITGATGFAGSHALEALQRRPELRLIAACRDPARLPPGFTGEVRAGDLRDPDYRRDLLQGVNVVAHCMAWTSLYGHADASRRLHLEPSLALLDEAVARGVGRFIHLSTTSAAAPERARNSMSRGIPRPFWPHLNNVIALENALRARAGGDTTMVNLRLGIYAGRRYNLGLLPILVPRLRTQLVPWVAGGRTGLPITAGEDIGEAIALAATVPGLGGYEAFNIVGPAIPTVRQVIDLLHDEFGLPRPHFSVPFPLAYAFGWLMERLDLLAPWPPLVTRSIVHLLEETGVDNARAEQILGYRPRIDWREALRAQMTEMAVREQRPMALHRPLPDQ